MAGGSGRAGVRLQRRPNLLKIRLLAPFVPRYRVLQPMCALAPEMLPLVARAVVSQDGTYVLMKNPKAGTNTLMQRMYEWQTGTVFDGPIHGDHAVLRHGPDATPEIVRALTDPGCRFFSFVRHPLRRVSSAFTNFLMDRRNGRVKGHLPHLERMGYRSGQDPARSFDIFLDYIALSLATDAAYTDQHFRPQVLNLRPDLIGYAFLGRIEALAEDLRRLEDLLGVASPFDAGTDRPQNPSYHRYFPTPAQRARVEDIFAADYEAFGY